MKQLLAILFTFAMVFALTACSTTPDSNPGIGHSGISGTFKDPAKDDGYMALADFQEIVVEDNEDCAIRITGIEPDSIWGYSLKVLLENKSVDKTFMFSVVSAAINGVSADPFFASEVAPGKKANETISFITDELEKNGIGDFTHIQLDFNVYDSNDWTAESIAVASANVYPYGEENAVSFTRTPQSTDVVLVDNDQISVTVTGFEQDEIWGYTANLYVVNKTDVPVMVTADEVSVNGFMVDPFFADSVPAGKCAFTSMSWSDSALEENSIPQVETIEFILRVYNENDWMADDYVNQHVTLNP